MGVISWYMSLVCELVHSRACLVSSVPSPSTLMLCGCVMLEVSIVCCLFVLLWATMSVQVDVCEFCAGSPVTLLLGQSCC